MTVTITLEVGSDKFPIRVPKLPLTETSVFFNNALNGHFVEARTNILPLLPTDKPDFVFRMVKWIITGEELDSRNDVNDSWEGQKEEEDYYDDEHKDRNDVNDSWEGQEKDGHLREALKRIDLKGIRLAPTKSFVA
ncbi:hypothetical protein SLS54_000082 [Diplodia seriata]